MGIIFTAHEGEKVKVSLTPVCMGICVSVRSMAAGGIPLDGGASYYTNIIHFFFTNTETLLAQMNGHIFLTVGLLIYLFTYFS